MSLTAAQTELIETWQRTCRQMVEFFEQNQRPPRIDSRDPEERQLALWIVSQVRNYTHRQFFMKSEYFRQIWSELRSTWTSYLTTPEEGWQINCDKLVAFLDEHGRRPKHHAETDYEKWLHFWMVRQHRDYDDESGLMAEEKMRQKWDQIKEKYYSIRARADRWNLTLDRVTEFVTRHHQGTSAISDDRDERRINGWVGVTNNAYRNGTLKPDRKKRWEKFCLNQGLMLTSFPAAWFKMRHQVIDFYTQHRRRPSNKSDSPEEQEIAYWLRNQRTDYTHTRGLMIDLEIRVTWMAMRQQYPELTLNRHEWKRYRTAFRSPSPSTSVDPRVRRIDRWCQIRDELVLFYNTHRRPPQRKKGTSSEEDRLFNWIHNQRISVDKRKGVFAFDVVRAAWKDLLKKYPVFDQTVESRWLEKFNQLCKFLDTEQRIPSTVSSDQAEMLLGHWCHAQRRSYRVKSGPVFNTELRIRWEAMVNRHRPLFMTAEKKWIEKRRLLVEFFETHQRAPSTTSDDSDEVDLAMWMYHQYQHYDHKSGVMKSGNFRKSWRLLIKRFPQFVRDQGGGERWFWFCDRLGKFLEAHGRRPYSSSADRAESKLGRWLDKQKKRTDYDREMTAAWKKLRERFPKLMVTGKDRWWYHRDLLCEFFDTHGRKPVSSSTDRTERTLSFWIQTQKDTYKKRISAMRHAEIRAEWKRLVDEYPEYTSSWDERWFSTRDEVVRFIETHGRRPKHRANEPDEMRLSGWIAQQAQHYQKGSECMKSEAIRTAWENLLLTYEQPMVYHTSKIKRQLAAIKAR